MEYTAKYTDRVDANCGIYKIRNTVNGKVYIGQSKNIYWRWMSHKCSLNHRRFENPHLQYAWDKYGQDAFEFSIIELCEEDMLDSREIYWIQEYNATVDGYNVKEGGNRHSGWKMTDDQRMNISNALKGRVRTPEHCKNISEGRKRYYETHIPTTSRCVVCLNTGEEFANSSVASAAYPSADKSAIHACCKGRLKSCGKLNGACIVWAYKEDYDKMDRDEINLRLLQTDENVKHDRFKKPVICLTTGEVFQSVKEASMYYGVHYSCISACLHGKQYTSGRSKETNEPLRWAFYG